MIDANPNLIQSHPSYLPPTTPLILIHDGGGTTFGYFSLGSLGRNLWAIHNPNFMTSTHWTGGIDAMAVAYVQLLRDAGVQGEVFLGGWSLGGLVALAMAKLLAEAGMEGIGNTILVKGLLIIDTSFHVPGEKHYLDEFAVQSLPDLVRISFDHAVDMMAEWKLPVWTGTSEGRQLKIGDMTVGAGEVLNVGVGGDENVEFVGHYEGTGGSPPWGVLVKATRRIEGREGAESRGDQWRGEKVLGWEGRYPEFLKAVVEVDASHFELFDLSRIDEMTGKINRALSILDKGVVMVV